MKKLSKKIFLLPLCALIANPFSAAFAVRTRRPKPRPNPAMAERKIEGCFKSDRGVSIAVINRFTDTVKGLLKGNAIVVKIGLLFVVMDEAYKGPAIQVFRDRHDLKEVFDAQIAKYSDLLHRVNLSEGDRGCLNVIFATWMADIFQDLSKHPEEEDPMGRFIKEFTRRLMSSDEVRSVCDNYRYGNELLNFLFDVAHINLDNNSKLSMYPLFHCLRMLLA